MLTLDRPLAFFDLEATGTDPDTARIIQIAIWRLTAHEIHGSALDQRWDQLIDPGRPIPARIQELTGITDEDLADAPPFDDVADTVRDLIADADLCAYHGLGYDVPLLEAEWGRACGGELPGPEGRVVVDPYRLEQALQPRTLEAVYERYTGDVLEGAHDAEHDVRALHDVLDAQIATHLDEDVTACDLADLARGDYLDDGRKLRQCEDGQVEVCFGKHRGATLTELQEADPSYLDWMRREIDDLTPHIDEALS